MPLGVMLKKVARRPAKNAALVWDGTAPDWKAITGAVLSGFTAGLLVFGAADGSLTSDATLSYSGGVLGATGLAVTGAATIGTTLGVTGVATVTNATDASDSATAALVTAGGVAMAKNLWVGANVAVGIAISLNCAAANGGFLKYVSANTLRWQHGRVGSTHDWRIEGYDSSGVLTDIPLTIANAAGGAFTIVRPISATSTLAVTGTTTAAAINASGNIAIGASDPFSRGYGRILTVNSASDAGIEVNVATGQAAVIDLGVNASRLFSLVCNTTAVSIDSITAVPMNLMTNNTTRLQITAAGDIVITSGSAVQLGNAYVATPQVCTGYVTIKDSAGTTYKVLVAA